MGQTVIRLDDHRPHVVIHGTERVHVIPVAVFQKITTGTLPLSDIDDADDFMPTVIQEWLSLIETGE